MPAAIETLRSYIPTIIARRLSTDNSASVYPFQEFFPAAVLFADISGFTPLTESLAKQGPVGAETLSNILSNYFGQLIDIITDHGGDIVKFAGDAVLAIWPAESDDQLAASIARAGECALATQSKLTNYQADTGHSLSLTIGVGGGELQLLQVGGLYNRWEILLVGQPIRELSTIDEHARSGEVILTPFAWNQIAEIAQGRRLSTGHAQLKLIEAPPPYIPMPRPHIPESATRSLRSYLPGAILSRLGAGQSDWLAELRNLTVLFVNLPSFRDGVTLEKAQKLMFTLQQTVYRYEGSLNKLSLDDKGVTFIAAMGFPPLSHEDDPIRGLQVALDIRNRLKEMGVEVTIGVTTGRVFCGSLGNTKRREYTMIGDIVNLSARLMQVAKKRNLSILCDESTYVAAEDVIEFKYFPPVQVKGKSKEVEIFQPRGKKQAPSLSSIVMPQSRFIIGRRLERRQIQNTLQALKDHQSNTIIIEGEAGIGKSRLVEDIKLMAGDMGLTVFHGAADAVEKRVAYHTWRDIFAQMFDLGVFLALDDKEAQRRHFIDLLDEDEYLIRLAPLLNAVIPFDFPDNETTKQMRGQVRADNTRDLLIYMLKDSLERSPKILILEDVHWMDSASWALALTAARELSPTTLIIVTRPLNYHGATPPREFELLKTLDKTTHLQLKQLSEAETISLVKNRLGVIQIDEAITDFVQHKAEGHPFFTEELIHALRDAEVIKINDDICELTTTPENLKKLNFPNTIQGIITSRIDRLSPPEQLALKVASVIGRVFAFQLLRDIYPVDNDKPQLANYLLTLETEEITLKESPEPDLSYIFKHAITHEVTYDLMLYAQRRELHKAVAEWYESKHTADLSKFYALLAHHWGRAADTDKAITYFEQAAEQALKEGVYHEALLFLERLWDSSQLLRERGEIPKLRLARWQRQQGAAFLNIGDIPRARHHLELAHFYLDLYVPQSNSFWVLMFIRDLGQQLRHRLMPKRFIGHGQDPEYLLEVARTGSLLSEVYFFGNETIPLLAEAMRIFNRSEQYGVSPELAADYAGMCVTSGAVPLHRLARYYYQRASETAAEIGQDIVYVSTLPRAHIYQLGIANWDVISQELPPVLEIAKKLQERKALGEILTILGEYRYLRGDFSGGQQYFNELIRVADINDNSIHAAWARTGCGQNLLRQGYVEQAIQFYEEAAQYLARNSEQSEEIRVNGNLAAAYCLQGDLGKAEEYAALTRKLLDNTLPTNPFMLEGYAGVAYVFLTLWSKSGTEYQQAAKEACQQMKRFARTFPIGRPRARLYWGWYQALCGRVGRAQRSWQKGVTVAQNLKMPFEEALLYRMIGRHHPAQSAERQEWIGRAQTIFGRLNAIRDIEISRKLYHE